MENETIKFIRQKDYKLIKNIGRGATGATVLLEDEMINQFFVCKKYQPAMGIDPKLYYDKFVDEIKMLFLINNRNVVRVFNYYLYPEQSTGYILMEYVEGQSILDYLSWSPEEINEIFIQILLGFISLEESEILHRDIRDSNILVSKEGVVKIIDFGFGKQVKIDKKFDKSISLNWWCDTPDEFEKGIYDFATEVYFVGKLIEKAILDNSIEGFQYSSELRMMIFKDPEKRIKSFKDTYSMIMLKPDLEENFNDDEIQIYRSFVTSLDNAITQINKDAKYYTDIDQIISKLEECYKKNMLEVTVINNAEIARAIISGSFYINKTEFYVAYLKDFIRLLKGIGKNKQRIIYLNLANRLNNKERYSDDFFDDIPF